MVYFSAIAGVIAAVAVVFFLRERKRLLQSSAELLRRCEKAELERAMLEDALSRGEREHAERFSRLEHDLRSSISIAVGFASLLKESVSKDSEPQPYLLLKSANGILESISRSLKILDAAAPDSESREEAALFKKGDESSRGDLEAFHSR